MSSRTQQEASMLRNTHNGISRDTRQALVDLLNARLAAAIDLRVQAKQAHWNLRGPRFIALHELFDQVASAGSSFQDLLGERVAQLGGYAAGTIEAVCASSSLATYPVELSREADHVRCMTDALARFTASARAGVSECENLEDVATADILTEITREADKLLWFVEAHLDERGLGGETRDISSAQPAADGEASENARH